MVADILSDQGGQTLSNKQLPSASAYGRTYGEWAAKWWTWAFEINADENPITDPDGRYAHIGQATEGTDKKVWFLAGTFGGHADRSITIPKDRALFVAMVNGGWFHCVGEQRSEQEMRGDLAWQADRYCQTTCTLDGEPITFSTVMVRTQSPLYSFTVPDDFVLGFTCEPDFEPPVPGTVLENNLAVGMWAMIPPLEPGEHVLEIHGGVCDPRSGRLWFETSVTNHLTIE